jgi:hypothetical protein
MFARYTFFETATQKGFLMSVLADLLPEHWKREVVSPSDGTEFILSGWRQAHEDDPTWHCAVTGRLVRESTPMWQERVRSEAIAEWERFALAEADRIKEMREAADKGAADRAAAAEKAQHIADAAATAALLASSAAVLTPAVAEAPPAPVKAAKAKGKSSR